MESGRLNLRHLDVFAAIVRLGSVSAAASAANLTQPAVTQGLSRLERELGVALFERHPGGMTATPAARGFAPRVEAALIHVASRRVTMAQLTAFVAVARDGSYVSASAITGLAQPSLHRAIRDLSLALGRSLIERRGRGLALTAAGLRVARGFRLALAELDAGLAELAGLQGVARGRIAIGAMPLARARVLPAIVAAYHRDFPHVEIVIAEGSHAELIEPLRDGELDVLIGALRNPVPGPDVVQIPLFDDHPVIIGRAEHPLTHRPHTTEQLAEFEWVVPARGTPLRTMWEAIFTTAGVAVPRVPVECGSVMLIRGLLLDSDCLTMLSPDQVAIELAAGLLATIGSKSAGTVRTIGLTTRTGWIPTPDQRAFIARAIATAKQTS